MDSRLKIVMIASECVPFAKTGGLADVVGALPIFLRALGHEVIVVMPKYGSINSAKFGLQRFWNSLGVWMGNTQEWCAVDVADSEGVPAYFIEHERFFGRPGLYHDEAASTTYADNPRSALPS
jgi:starch synthase